MSVAARRGPTRRDVLAASLAAAGDARRLRAPTTAPRFDGGWVGDNAERGHRCARLAGDEVRRARRAARERRGDVLVVGGGIAGLAAARALQRAGIDDFAVLELEDARRRQQPRPRDARPALPARRALPAAAGGERDAR